MMHHWPKLLAAIFLIILCEFSITTTQSQHTLAELNEVRDKLASAQADSSKINECYPDTDNYVHEDQSGNAINGTSHIWNGVDLALSEHPFLGWQGFHPIPQDNGSDKWLAISVRLNHF